MSPYLVNYCQIGSRPIVELELQACMFNLLSDSFLPLLLLLLLLPFFTRAGVLPPCMAR